MLLSSLSEPSRAQARDSFGYHSHIVRLSQKRIGSSLQCFRLNVACRKHNDRRLPPVGNSSCPADQFNSIHTRQFVIED
jgi:hypothetical protein